MKYYKRNNELFGFESDGSQDYLITLDMVRVQDSELSSIINPVVEPEIIVTPWQFRKALNQLNIRDVVEQLVKSPTTPLDIKDGWEFATEWKEFDPTLKTMAYALGLSDADIHDIFTVAASL